MTAPTLTAERVLELRKEAESAAFTDEKRRAEALALCDLAIQRLSAEPERPVAWGMIASNTGRMCSVTMEYEDVEDLSPEHVIELFASPQRPAVPEGYRLAPVEPTREMVRAGNARAKMDVAGAWVIDPEECYAAMLAAAPETE